MLNLQTTASSKNEQSAIQSATQKKNEGGNGDFLGALLASLNSSKDTSHTSSNVSNENKAPQSAKNTQNTQSTQNSSQNSPQTEFGEQNSQKISENSSSQNSSQAEFSEQAISDATLETEEGKSVALSELSASKGDASTENMPEQ